jgi:zinc/manganese transport system substrate-binding protein
MRRTPVISVALVAILALSGCASTSAAADGRLQVVASTDVYGDIAQSIGGGVVDVTSIISDPSQDPHSYEGDAQVQLSLSQADVVIQNGGGYDDFVTTLLSGAHNPDAVVLNAATISGIDQHPATGEFNEHVWYDFPTVKRVVDKIAATFSRLAPKDAGTFAANARTFDAKLAQLESQEAAIKATSGGVGAAITEPVPLYMLTASGIVNKTPAAFSQAIESGTDVSPAVLQQTLALFSDHAVKLLAYNEQTTGPETEAVLAAAKKANIAIVPVTETLPAHKDYLSWMASNLSAIRAAVS